jgi:2'-hydroxyisoflavone reductase
MRILVLGGTQFLGRHSVEAALARGHEVTMFNRGQTRPELFPDVEKLRGDRDGNLDTVRGRGFDAVVDTSGYVPRIVGETIHALGDVGHYTFVSSISVYADASTPPTESSPVAELEEPTEEWREAYGELKADCEDVVRERFPSAFIPRPGLIVGPWDPTGRFTYWPERLADGGRVLAPAPPDADAQVIDARDLAEWIVRSSDAKLSGVFNAVGPREPLTMDRLLETISTTTSSDAGLHWTAADLLLARGIEEYVTLPLWLVDPAWAGLGHVANGRAVAAGLTFRPLEETVRDTLVWIRSGERLFVDQGRPRPGLDPELERELIAA